MALCIRIASSDQSLIKTPNQDMSTNPPCNNNVVLLTQSDYDNLNNQIKQLGQPMDPFILFSIGLCILFAVGFIAGQQR